MVHLGNDDAVESVSICGNAGNEHPVAEPKGFSDLERVWCVNVCRPPACTDVEDFDAGAARHGIFHCDKVFPGRGSCRTEPFTTFCERPFSAFFNVIIPYYGIHLLAPSFVIDVFTPPDA